MFSGQFDKTFFFVSTMTPRENKLDRLWPEIILQKTDTVFKTTHFIDKLRVGPIRQSFCPWQAFPA
jgi:hypothetical protein